MGRAILAHNELALTATYTGGTWEGTLTPERQLTNRLITAMARTTTTATLALDVSIAGEGQTYDLISILNHNLSSAATVQIEIYSDISRTIQTYDSGALPVTAVSDVVVTPVFSHLMPTPLSDAHLTLTIIDAANPDGYFELGRVTAHSAWQPTFNVTYGAALGWDDLSEVLESTTGIEFYDKRTTRRTASLPYQALTDVERKEVEAMIGREGVTGEVLFCFDDDVLTSNYSRTYLARMAKVRDVRMVDFDFNTISITVQEIL
jgi:hypothetical protein